MIYDLQQAELDWKDISNRVNAVEETFRNKLRRAITSTVSSDKVSIIFDRKNFDSAYEKCLNKNCSFDDLTDLLRATVLYSRNIDPERIVDGIIKIFGKGNVLKIDRRDVPRPGREYFGSIHVDIKVNDIPCEIQIMRKNLYSYVKETRQYYKTPEGKRIKDLPEKQKNIEKMLFEKANKPQKFEQKRFEPEIENEASLIKITNIFYKIATLLSFSSKEYRTTKISDNKNKKMVTVRFPAFLKLKATDGTMQTIELEPETEAIYVTAPSGYKFVDYQLHEMFYDPQDLNKLKNEKLEPCNDPVCDYCNDFSVDSDSK